MKFKKIITKFLKTLKHKIIKKPATDFALKEYEDWKVHEYALLQEMKFLEKHGYTTAWRDIWTALKKDYESKR